MNPDNRPESYSIDYLNQIAPKPPKKFQFNQLQTVLMGGTGLVLIIILTVSLVGLFGRSSQPLERLAARLLIAEETASSSQANLKDTVLRSVNSGLQLNLTNANRDIAPLLSKEGINSKKLNASIVAEETDAGLNTRLEDARLNAIFDRTYAREMAYQLEVTITTIRQIYNSTSKASLQKYLNETLGSLTSAQQAFKEFKDATDS